MDEDLSAAIQADQQRRREFAAKVAAGIASGLCADCARGYHIAHRPEWRPSVLGGEPINGCGECAPFDTSSCNCEWRN